jgi:protein AFG1
MTTSPGYQAEEWTPLDPSGRIWETNLSASLPTSTLKPVQDKIRTKEDLSDDLAVEAGYSRPGRLTPEPTPKASEAKRKPSPKSTDERVIDHPTKGPTRHSPPVIKEQHVWGVAEEWGGRAGKWGQGTKAFDPSDTSEPEGKKDS